MEFKPFPKMQRLSREIIITEKIDGTNAQIFIGEDGEFLVGSRTRWITPENDNYGFAKWAMENKEELMKLGPGSHFGEWYGQKIQRTYGMNEKRFVLFNVRRWEKERPICCDIVPILYQGIFSEVEINNTLECLKTEGSRLVPGFMDPEGVIVFHVPAGIGFKKTIKDDETPKGALVSASN